MVITIQVGGWGRPVRLLSRDEPILEGAVPAWPPRGGSIELVNGPIHYYDEREVDSPGREPVLSVTANSVEFGLDEVALLARPPQIRSAHVVRDGTPERGARTSGVELQWDDTRGHVIDEPPVRWYHVYRQFEGDALNGWVRVRSLPANVTKWVDRGFDGTQAALYLVLHAGEYPFGYRYESLLPTPVRVAASLEASPA
jgi:hypothetical protein